MSNRLSQILNGNKEIQVRDLPWFCLLLEVSCEEILSAGEYCMPSSAHLTNYAAAFSKDKREWEAYIERADSPILNADEYGKTVINYALEAENYAFLKYLMDENYIWFVGPDEKNYYASFGAGTSIKKEEFPYFRNLKVLDAQLKMQDDLRTDMVALAIKHKDFEMLDRLHAREIPALHQLAVFALPPDCGKYYNEKLMEALFCANREVLEYFSDELQLLTKMGLSINLLSHSLGN